MYKRKILLYCKLYFSDKEIELRLKTLRAGMTRPEPRDDDDDEPVGPATVEKTYITAVMREVISNSTSTACDSGSGMLSGREMEIKKIAGDIHDLTVTLYYVSHSYLNIY